MLRRRPDVDARVAAFADRLIACVRRADVDEIIIAGHSLGATIVIDMLARALARDPDLGRHGPKLGVLTIGATIPKLALHPAGGWLREAARRIAAEPSLPWAEYQARDDVISFHKFHPVELTRFNDVNDASPPVIRRVQIHEMLSEAAFRRHRFNFMRLHYQFVMANERRALYDYFMLICGPAPFWQTVNQANGPVVLCAGLATVATPPSRVEPP
jgi:pimeloyl-ACP methyl ester carboxylesterase